MYYIIRLIRECYNPKWHIIYNVGFFFTIALFMPYLSLWFLYQQSIGMH